MINFMILTTLSIWLKGINFLVLMKSVCIEIFSELPDVYTDSCVKTTLQPVTTPLPADVCKQIKVTGSAHPVAAYGMGGTYTKSINMHNGYHYWEAVSLFKSD